MRVKVEHFVDLDAVAIDAGTALDGPEQERLYDTLDWFRLTQAHILSDVTPLVARARSGDASAWLFLALRPGRSADPFGSWYTLRFAPVFSGTVNGTTKVALLAAIARSLRGKLRRISLRPLIWDDFDVLRTAFRRSGWLTEHGETTVNWIARTAGDNYEAYWAKRPRQLRNTVRRKAVKADLTIRTLDRFDEAAWSAYEAVFAASWKGEEGSAPFLRALAMRCSDWGTLRMGIATDAAGTPLAAQFWTIDGAADATVATIHKLAYVDAAKALSPGSVLSQAMFRYVLDHDAPAIIDFGTGDDPYKADWMDERRPLYRLDAYNSRTVGGLAAYARTRIAALVQRVRSG